MKQAFIQVFVIYACQDVSGSAGACSVQSVGVNRGSNERGARSSIKAGRDNPAGGTQTGDKEAENYGLSVTEPEGTPDATYV